MYVDNVVIECLMNVLLRRFVANPANRFVMLVSAMDCVGRDLLKRPRRVFGYKRLRVIERVN